MLQIKIVRTELSDKGVKAATCSTNSGKTDGGSKSFTPRSN